MQKKKMKICGKRFCGCKGKRFCLKCRDDFRFEVKKKSQQFVYCNLCGDLAFKIDLEPHSLHSIADLIEFKDYVNISGLTVLHDVIGEDKENQLIKRIDEDKWVNFYCLKKLILNYLNL